ncbi:MAG: rhodanese-like domain-containing protein [Bdellovibrionales bacterium]|nr:rhodanese-like domain-containing protein [Bdellovibrionales bacterium]
MIHSNVCNMKKNILLVVALAAVATFFPSVNSFAAAVDCDKEETFPLISKSDLKKELDSKVKPMVVDVNSESRFKEGHVGGKETFHFGTQGKEFKTALEKMKAEKKTDALIVAYCGGPQCTAWHKAAKEACKMGFTNVKHFKDGISGWEKN